MSFNGKAQSAVSIGVAMADFVTISLSVALCALYISSRQILHSKFGHGDRAIVY